VPFAWGQPHPIHAGFRIDARILCLAGECYIPPVEVCNELSYFGTVCVSASFDSAIEGTCFLHGNYSQTQMTLESANHDLPFTRWQLNFESGDNPVLQTLRQPIVGSVDQPAWGQVQIQYCLANISVTPIKPATPCKFACNRRSSGLPEEGTRRTWQK